MSTGSGQGPRAPQAPSAPRGPQSIQQRQEEERRQQQQQQRPNPGSALAGAAANEVVEAGVERGVDAFVSTAAEEIIPAPVTPGAFTPTPPTPIGTDISGGTMMSNGSVFPGSQAPPPSTPVTGAPGMFQAGGPLATAGAVAAGAYTGAQQFSGAKNFFEGERLSTTEKAALALPTFGLSLISDNLQDAFGLGSGKHKDQQLRDRWRRSLQELGVSDDQHLIQFSDGSVFDMGKDGGARLVNVDGESTRPFYNVDANHPFSHQAIGWTQPLTAALSGGNLKVQSDMAGYFTNAILSDADSLEEVRLKAIQIYQDAGVSPDELKLYIDNLVQQGKYTPEEGAAFKNGIDTLYRPNSGVEGSVNDYLAQAPPQGVANGAAPSPQESAIPEQQRGGENGTLATPQPEGAA